MNPEIGTYSGNIFNYENITENSICIEDIAHSLSLICRYTGHVRKFYSVAEHCYRMSIEDLPGTPISRLMHDSAEAYIGDINSPLKRLLSIGVCDCSIRNYEAIVVGFIENKLRIFIHHTSEDIKTSDKIMMMTEIRDLMHPKVQFLYRDWAKGIKPLETVIEPMTSEMAETAFLNRFKVLTNVL